MPAGGKFLKGDPDALSIVKASLKELLA